jgi:hypothetical protein
LAHEIETLFSDPANPEPLPMPVNQEDSDAQERQSGSGAAQQEACTDSVHPTTSIETGAVVGDSDSDSDSVSLPSLRRRSQEGGRRPSSSVVGQPGPQDIPARPTFGTLKLTPYQRNLLVRAFEGDYPIVYQQRNPKQIKSKSRERYEKSKAAKTLREAVLFGATHADIAWDYIRGFLYIAEPQSTSEQSVAAAATADEPHHPPSSHSSNYCTFSMVDDLQQAFMAHSSEGSLSPDALFILKKIRKRIARFAHSYGVQVVSIDPTNRREAMASPDALYWLDAEDTELLALFELGCFELVSEAEARQHGKFIASKWVYKVKLNPDGTVQRYKARLVAKGFTQVPGSDYFDTYSPVFGHTSFRTILALAAKFDWQLDVWDLKNGFIQQDIDVPHLYMRCPEGHPYYMPDGSKAVLHVVKAIYGLKQSSRLLNKSLSAHLLSLGFTKLRADQCVFTKGSGPEQVVVCIWVDDIILATGRHNHAARNKFDADLRSNFKVSPWTAGEANVFLGLKITRNWEKGLIHVSLEQMIERLAEQYGLDDHKGAPSVPMDPDLKLAKPAVARSSADFDYPAAVGALLYVTVTVRPDIAYAVGVLSRHMSCFGDEHISAAQQVIRYIYGTRTWGITFSKYGPSSPHLGEADPGSYPEFAAYTDADLAGDLTTRRSTGGFSLNLSGGTISWSSKRQPTVALSTAEAEILAAIEGVKQIMHVRMFLHELGFPQRNPTVVYEDNQAAIAMVASGENAKRAKYYQMKVCFLQEQQELGEFNFSKVGTAHQLADVFTKALPRDKFNYFRALLGVHPSSIIAVTPDAI